MVLLARVLGISVRLLFATIASVALLATVPYAVAPSYRFAPAAPFRGGRFYNPYDGPPARWLMVNLHAHARAWGGITNGKQEAPVVRERYRALGFDVASVSNYMQIDHGEDQDTAFLPAYEHGVNVMKSHRLAIGARSVAWFDFVGPQSVEQKQYLVDAVHRGAELVAINHPSTRRAYSASDMRQLSGYELLEVMNQSEANDSLWDAALSAGRPVWLLASDDTHDITNANETGRTWTMVRAASSRAADVIAALRAGRAYGVRAPSGRAGIALRSLTLRGDTLLVRTNVAASAITFVGQGGAVLELVRAAARASYVIRGAEPYVRTVIEHGTTRIVLNPVIRFDGTIPRPAAIPMGNASFAAGWVLTAGAGLVLLLFAWATGRGRRIAG
ncbi:MAG TPA: hypothetical protein VMS45_03060 [Gemmatimonadaceae bacterium]|nr:hypothetical protein [Gemmatimonadaceae bacterium]